MNTREWSWIPHLLTLYTVLGLLWFVTGFALWAGADSCEAVFGSDAPPELGSCPPSNPSRLAYVLWLVLVAIPLLAVAATIRVVLNEQRWRREGDARGQ
jgi:hypothetical protein